MIWASQKPAALLNQVYLYLCHFQTILSMYKFESYSKTILRSFWLISILCQMTHSGIGHKIRKIVVPLIGRATVCLAIQGLTDLGYWGYFSGGVEIVNMKFWPPQPKQILEPVLLMCSSHPECVFWNSQILQTKDIRCNFRNDICSLAVSTTCTHLPYLQFL